MEKVLKNPDAPGNRDKINTAFGRNANLNIVKDVVHDMKDGHMSIRTPDKTHPGSPKDAQAVTEYWRDAKKNPILGPNGSYMKNVDLGRKFYDDLGKEDRAGTLIHEAAHLFSMAGDHVDKRVGKEHQILTANKFNHKAADAIKNGGCE